MKKTNAIVMSVGTIILVLLLILSTINTTSVTTTPTNTSLSVDPYPQLDAEKKVKYGSSGWVDEIQVPIGATVRFNISVIYHDINPNDSCSRLSKINIVDHLGNFEYQDYAFCSWPTVNPNDYVKYNYSTNTYTWKFNNNLILNETSHKSIFYLEFDAKVNYTGSFRNYVEVNGTESCCGHYAYSDADAFVQVNEPENPAINLTKYVKENTNWVKSKSVNIGEVVYFKLFINNTGNVALTNVNVTDDLPSFLTFNNDANITPAIFSNHHIEWNLWTLAVDQTIEIIFSADVIASGTADNSAIVTTFEGPTDDDTAHIIMILQGDLCCTKTVWDSDTQQWVEQINADIGDTVRFKITFTYTGEGSFMNLKVKDILPPCLQYANNANPVETGQSGNIIFWNLSGSLSTGQSASVEFNALIIASGINTNLANITGSINCHIPRYCEDTAIVIVGEPQEEGDLICQKQVWDTTTQQWVEQITTDLGDTVRFKITLIYQGSGTLVGIKVKDSLPVCLQYADNAIPIQTGQNGKTIYWNLSSTLLNGQNLSIQFDAKVISNGPNTNTANITGLEHCTDPLYCEDTATVIVREPQGGLACQKQVWDPETQRWVEQINADIGDIVRFKITFTYTGGHEFKYITVKDTLPACLQYADNAIPIQTGQNGKTIYWNLSSTLLNGQNLSIQFDTKVISNGTNTNTANITGLEHCTDPLYCEDTATVIVREPQGGLACQKQVWDPETQRWVEQINADIGDIVRFKITFTYTGGHEFKYITVKDTLPACLQYADNAIPIQTGQNGKTIYWNLSSTLLNGQNLSIQFDTKVISNGTNTNTANITGSINGQIPLYCEDTATVIVQQLPPPDLRCEKKVWDPTTKQWVEQINAKIGDTVRFKITISYWGSLSFYNFWINDTLPACLQYNNSATPYQPTAVDGKKVTWYLAHFIKYGQNISLEFNTLVISAGTNINKVNITGWECGIRRISCDDTATVIVEEEPNLLCETKVWDPITQQWVEQINAEIGDIVRFKITISYWGSLSFYNFWINDTLPACLQYNNSATPYQPTAVDGKQVKWYLLLYIQYSQSISLEFNAKVISNGTNINVVNITGWECGIRRLFCQDTATVIVENEPVIADAHGPYIGYTSESIQFTGSATGGVFPYTCQWDFDNDNIYDDGSGVNPTYSWSLVGTYTISIKVIDSMGKNDTDSAHVTVSNRNTAPNDPVTPDGSESGKTKTDLIYSSSAVDPDGDQVYLLFDWDDGTTSGWLGPFASGVTHVATHTWTVRGSYSIKVKAKDANGVESLWSDPLTISIKMNIIGTIFEKIIDHFPALEHLITVLLNIIETMRLNYLSL